MDFGGQGGLRAVFERAQVLSREAQRGGVAVKGTGSATLEGVRTQAAQIRRGKRVKVSGIKIRCSHLTPISFDVHPFSEVLQSQPGIEDRNQVVCRL